MTLQVGDIVRAASAKQRGTAMTNEDIDRSGCGRNGEESMTLQQAEQALEIAEKQFLYYRDQHEAKPPTPDTMAKAKVNTLLATQMGKP